MGLLATGTNCLAFVYVSGRRRVPAPPASMRAFTSALVGQVAVDPLVHRPRAGSRPWRGRRGRGVRGPGRLEHAGVVEAGEHDHVDPFDGHVLLAYLGAGAQIALDQAGLRLLAGAEEDGGPLGPEGAVALARHAEAGDAEAVGRVGGLAAAARAVQHPHRDAGWRDLGGRPRLGFD